MKWREQDVYWQSDKKNVVVVYNRDSMGDKWSVRRKVHYKQFETNDYSTVWEFVISFDSVFGAMNYAKKMYDGSIYR